MLNENFRQNGSSCLLFQIDFLAHDGPQSRLPVYSDLLTCVSSVPGFSSFRHTGTGSWFIQTLCEKIQQLSNQ